MEIVGFRRLREALEVNGRGGLASGSGDGCFLDFLVLGAGLLALDFRGGMVSDVLTRGEWFND